MTHQDRWEILVEVENDDRPIGLGNSVLFVQRQVSNRELEGVKCSEERLRLVF